MVVIQSTIKFLYAGGATNQSEGNPLRFGVARWPSKWALLSQKNKEGIGEIRYQPISRMYSGSSVRGCAREYQSDVSGIQVQVPQACRVRGFGLSLHAR